MFRFLRFEMSANNKYGQVHIRIQSIQTEAPHMISKGCKSLAEADFPIAEESRHATQECPAARQARAGETACKLQEPVKARARFNWQEITKVEHYQLDVGSLIGDKEREP